MAERIDIFIKNSLKEVKAGNAVSPAEKKALEDSKKQRVAEEKLIKKSNEYLNKRSTKSKKARRDAVTEASMKAKATSLQAKHTKKVANDQARQVADAEKAYRASSQRLTSMGMDSTSKKNSKLMKADLLTNGKITTEMRRQYQMQSKQVGATTRNAMNYLSIMFLGQKLTKMFTSIRRSATQAYTELTKGSDGANGSLLGLQATIKYIQFSLGAAIADFISPWMDDIAYFAETISDFISEYGTVVVTFIGTGTLAAYILQRIADIALLSASASNIKVMASMKGLIKEGSAVAAGAVAGEEIATGIQTGFWAGIGGWFTSFGTTLSSWGTSLGAWFTDLFAGIAIGAGGIATAAVSAVLIIGAGTNGANDGIEKVNKKMGILGRISNIVGDSFAILWNFFRLGIKSVTNLLSGLASLLLHGIKKRMEQTYNVVKWIVEAISKITMPDFNGALEGAQNAVEDFRAKTDKKADDTTWFKAGWDFGGDLIQSTPDLNLPDISNYPKLPDFTTTGDYQRYKEQMALYAQGTQFPVEPVSTQTATSTVPVTSAPPVFDVAAMTPKVAPVQPFSFDFSGENMLPSTTLATDVSIENNTDLLANTTLLGESLGTSLNTGFTNTSIDFKESVDALAKDTLIESFGGALTETNQGLLNQSQQLQENIIILDAFTNSTNNAAKAQERLNKAKEEKKKNRWSLFNSNDKEDIQSYS